jgi:WD40 repeat protein/serine/threonine protein kinase
MSNLVGKSLGPYLVLLKIRSTPTNTVYKAYDAKLGRNVALQIILPGQKLPLFLPARLKEHAKTLARLAHPNIPMVLDCDTYDGNLCIAYDCVPARILTRRFNHKLAWRQAAQQIAPVTQALAYAQSQGVAHGFIRPESILLDESGTPMLSDFGVEQVIADEVLAESAGSWLGSQVTSYTAPEQILGQTGDPRSDIYSLGMILYNLLTGRRAYEGETPLDEVLKRYEKPLKNLEQQLKELGDTERSILEKMLANQPERRFQKMDHAALLLAKYALNQPVHPAMVRNPGWKPRPPLPPLAWAGIGLGVLAILAAASIGALLLNPGLSNRLGFHLPAAPEQAVSVQATAAPTSTATPAATQTLASQPTATLAATKQVEPTQTATTAPAFRSTAREFQSLPFLFNTPVPPVSGAITSDNVMRLVTLNRLGIGLLNEIAWAPDGRLMALATSTGVYLVDPQTQAVTNYLNTRGAVHSVAFSADGSRIATGEGTGLVRIWETATGKQLVSLYGHKQAVNRVAFSPDGSQAASASDDKTARLWNIEKKEIIVEITQHVQAVTGVAFSPDGKTLATSSLDFHVMLWNTSSGERLKDMVAQAAVYDVRFFPDGKKLLTGGGDSAIQMWDAENGAHIDTLANTTTVIHELKISPDGRFVAIADNSGQVTVYTSQGEKLWSNRNFHLPRLLAANFAYTHHIAFSPDSTRLASGIWDDTVQIWAAENGAAAGLIDQYADFANTLEVSPNGKYLAAATTGGEVKVWDLPNATLLYTFPGEIIPGRAYSYQTNDSRYLAIKDGANDLKVYDLNDGSLAYTFSGHRELRSTAFSSDGVYLASGSGNDFHLWSLSSGQEIRTEKNFLNGCSIYKNLTGKTLARATGILIDFENTSITSLCGVAWGGWITSKSIQMSANMIAAGGASKLDVWNYQKGESTKKMMEGLTGNRVEQVAISPDGKLIAGNIDDITIRIWNAETGKEIMRLMGHEATLKGLVFSPDGMYLISSALDGTIRIWGVQ